MRTIAWCAAAAAGLFAGGCSDETCPDETYEVELGVAVAPADCPAGAHVLRGEADGVPFSCALDCRADTIVGGACEGGAVLEDLSPAGVQVRVPGTPEHVEVELVAAGSDAPLRRRELLGGETSGCGGPYFLEGIKGACEDGLAVDLPADLLALHEFSGTADGVEFACSYQVVEAGAAATEARDAACTGPVELVVEPRADGVRSWSDVRAHFGTGPADVAWTLVQTNEHGRSTGTGTATPAYAFDAEGCRVATASASAE